MPDNQRTDQILNDVILGSGIVIFGFGINHTLDFVTKIILAQYLGSARYGNIAMGATILGFISTITLMGMNQGLGRFLPRYSDSGKQTDVILTTVTIVIIFSSIAGGIILAFSPHLANVLLDGSSSTQVIAIFAIAVPFATLLKLTVGVIQGHKETRPKVVIQNLVRPGVKLCFVILVLVFSLSMDAAALAYTLSYLVTSVACLKYIYGKVELPQWSRNINLSNHFGIIRFSTPLMFTTMMLMVLTAADTFMLGYYSDTADVGVYNVVYPIAQLVTILFIASRFVLTPIFSDLDNDDDRGSISSLYQLVTKWLIALLVPVVITSLIMPEVIIGRLFGSEYTVGAAAFSILLIGFFSHAIFGPNEAALKSIGDSDSILLINLGVAVVNIILNILLIPEYTIIGAAVATASSYFLLNLLYAAQIYRKMGFMPFSGTGAKVLALGFLFTIPVFQFSPVTTGGKIAILIIVIGMYYGVITQLKFIDISEIKEIL